MFTEENRRKLEEKGYTVVPNILTTEECDSYIEEYREWLSQFTKHGEWPYDFQSIIKGFNISHKNATWQVRLKAKKLFSEVWKTEKLLTSFDAIAIARPPEDEKETFEKPEDGWFHVDFAANRVGLHAYQGAAFLEATDEDDWTSYFIEDSLQYIPEFFKSHPDAAEKSIKEKEYELCKDDIDWFKAKGCSIVRVPCPRGGIVLWDNRTVHANAKPIQGRKNAGRWRFVVFVSMTPAIWATDADLAVKKQAYNELGTTNHWSSQGVVLLTNIKSRYSKTPLTIDFLKTLPECATTEDAKLLSGIVPYDFEGGQSNGPDWFPKWT